MTLVDPVGVMTERLLLDAAIRPGMRVLDVGCGRGDVTLLLARLVGETGEVVGVDREAGPLAVARARAQELGLSRVRFIEGDFVVQQGKFDAAVGRRVLMYQPDPVEAVRRLALSVVAGGSIVFQEHDSTLVPASVKPVPLHVRVQEWIWRTVEAEGAHVHLGFELASVFERVGLTGTQVRAEAIVQTPALHYAVGAIVRAMLPRMLERGVATAEEIDVDTLDQRLIDERVAANATVISDVVFGAWGRVSGG